MRDQIFNADTINLLARSLVDAQESKRKETLTSLTSEIKCRVVEEMVNIRLNRLRDDNGTIQPPKVSER